MMTSAPGHFFFRVGVHRHAAAVVDHLQRAVFEMGDLDAVGETGNGLVHGIVDDFWRGGSAGWCRCTCRAAV